MGYRAGYGRVAVFGGIPSRGIYDNMKTAVDKVRRGKARTVNARFEAMASHYLFEPEFCNVASGWEKNIVEKNVQHQRGVWVETKHPEWPELTVVELLQDELPKLILSETIQWLCRASGTGLLDRTHLLPTQSLWHPQQVCPSRRQRPGLPDGHRNRNRNRNRRREGGESCPVVRT